MRLIAWLRTCSHVPFEGEILIPKCLCRKSLVVSGLPNQVPEWFGVACLHVNCEVDNIIMMVEHLLPDN